MRILAQGTTLGCALPALTAITVNPATGLLEDIVAGEWEISGPSGASAGPEAFDVAACPAGHRIGLGHYAVAWQVPASAPAGRWSAAFSYEFVGGTAAAYSMAFETIEGGFNAAGDPLAPAYTSIEELRCEGFKENVMPDKLLARRIKLASAMIEQFTSNRFEPAAKTIRIDARRARALPLREPIIAIGGLRSVLDDDDFDVLELEDVRVYNRHISQGLRQPDDRFNPKIELQQRCDGFIAAAQGLEIDGVFGFTEPDGGMLGRTPAMISLAAGLLVARYRDPLANGARADRMSAHLVDEERTIDQQRKLDRSGTGRTTIGGFTGDPEIDAILEDHRAPYSVA